MAGTINSLGIGSGVLTADIIEKLKANDEKLTVTPIDNKIALNKQKSEALDLLDSLMSTFKASASALADDTIFANRSVNGNTDGIEVSAEQGVATQSFRISDTSLARSNVLEAAGFSAKESTFASGNGTLNLNIGGYDHQITYTSSMTLEGLRDAINENAGDAVVASILQTDSNAYSLILSTKETGKDQTISIGDLGGNISASQLLSDTVASGSFTSADATVSTGSGSMALTIGDTTAVLDYTATTTLSDLAQSINDNQSINDAIYASVVKYGSDDFRLVLTSKSGSQNDAPLLTDLSGFVNASLLSDAYTTNTAFTSKNATVATDGTPDSEGFFRISIGGSDYDYAYDETTTLQELVDSINNDTAINASVTASIVEYGTNDFRLVLSNTPTSKDQVISTSDVVSAGSGLNAGLIGGSYINGATSNTEGTQNVIQDAKDATFKYNGITLTRSSNTIDDIIAGVTINLLQDAQNTNISITQDKDVISDELETFASSYNALMEQLQKMTTSDQEAGTIGIFNGDSFINGIRRDINKILTTFSDSGFALTQFGIELNQSGVMSYKSSSFYDRFNSDPEAAQLFFSGETKIDSFGNAVYVNGIFDDLDTTLNAYTNSSSGSFKTMSDGLTTDLKSLQNNYTRTVELLTARYDAMTAQFVQYDAIISKLNNQFSVLNNMIQAQLNAN
ncbi:MAG: flagellar filament capping protein FliD [Campylobacterales bacterium]|nr:flagellar filament capping protein FliD [Campylobacterales bacterium]